MPKITLKIDLVVFRHFLEKSFSSGKNNVPLVRYFFLRYQFLKAIADTVLILKIVTVIQKVTMAVTDKYNPIYTQEGEKKHYLIGGFP